MIAVAALAALAAAVLLGPAPQARLQIRGASHRARRRPRLRREIALPASVVAAGSALHPPAALLLAAGGVMAATLWFLFRSHLLRRRRAAAAQQCARAARVLASLLQAGQIPTTALAQAASDCPVLAPAAAAARLGGDIGEELGRAGRVPGQESMTSIAAAWSISERTGAPIADVLTGVAEALRRQLRIAAVVDAELAAARTSGHIMAVLPALAVGLGFAVGVNPLTFLTGAPLGRLLLLMGVALTASGVLWIDSMSRGSGR